MDLHFDTVGDLYILQGSASDNVAISFAHLSLHDRLLLCTNVPHQAVDVF